MQAGSLGQVGASAARAVIAASKFAEERAY